MSAPPEYRERLGFAQLDAFHQLRENPDLEQVITHLVRSPISEDWVLVCLRRYNLPDGQFGGVVAAAVDASYFVGLLSDLDLGPHGIALIRDLDRRLVARHPPLDAPPGQIGAIGGSRELTALMDAGVATGLFYSQGTADGIPRTDAFRRLEQLPVVVVAGLGEADYMAIWRHDRNKAMGDRKSTRLNSSHVRISYAVFCLKKKKQVHEISGAKLP